MNGKGKMKLKIGKTQINVTYRYSGLTEQTKENFNKLLAEREKK